MLSGRERKELRRLAMRAKDAGMRFRCKVVLGLVQGRTPTMIAQGGLCAKSQVYRVAERFIARGLTGLADRREDNGESEVSEFTGGSEVDAPLFAAILSRPQPARTHLEGSARQCHPQPPVRDDRGTHGRSERLPGTLKPRGPARVPKKQRRINRRVPRLRKAIWAPANEQSNWELP